MSMSSDLEVAEQVVSEFIEKRTGRRGISRDVHLFDHGLINSLFVIELLSFLELRFDVRVSVEELDLESFSTVEKIARFVGQAGAR
jgi:acyl carrier protein